MKASKTLRTATGIACGLIGLCAAASVAQAKPADYLKKPQDWFNSSDAKRVIENVLSHQSDLGGWPKNVDTTAAPFAGRRTELHPTFDNGATTDEIRLLVRYFNATRDERAKAAAEHGVDYVLKAQYPTGGWPQFYPPGKQYHRHITFNDDAMVRLLRFLGEVHRDPGFAFLDQGKRDAAKKAIDRGIQCILKCQIKVGDKLTAWCAQHDELDYGPRKGRAYELPSISGSESVGIIEFLMSIERPGPEVIRSVEAAVAWFESARLTGIRVDTVKDEKAPKGTNRVVVKDPSAPPLWARFYEIGSNRPIFCDRDGVVKYDLSEIGYERRNGYAWLGAWPQTILQKHYPAWKARITKETGGSSIPGKVR